MRIEQPTAKYTERFDGSEVHLPQVLEELVSLSKQLSEAVVTLKRSGLAYARAEKEYNYERAKAFLKEAKGDNKEAREASIEHLISSYRYNMTLAKSNKETELENVRSLRQQLSALQTVANSMKSEADAFKYGQGYGA